MKDKTIEELLENYRQKLEEAVDILDAVMQRTEDRFLDDLFDPLIKTVLSLSAADAFSSKYEGIITETEEEPSGFKGMH